MIASHLSGNQSMPPLDVEALIADQWALIVSDRGSRRPDKW